MDISYYTKLDDVSPRLGMESENDPPTEKGNHLPVTKHPIFHPTTFELHGTRKVDDVTTYLPSSKKRWPKYMLYDVGC